ncbi:MAG TPA: DUF885 family protein [Acidobacteriota bacterium]|nr:DUF885 family protein [Acidobacteriota bacterium]
MPLVTLVLVALPLLAGAGVPAIPQAAEPLPNIDTATSANGVVALPQSVSPAIRGVFAKYTKVVAPNGKPIHILAQDGWSDARIVKARNVLEHILRDVPGTRYGSDKRIVANAMADNRATLTLFRTEPDMRAAFRGPLRQVDLGMQDLRANEAPVEGHEDYMAHRTRDASYEEVLHMVHDYGIKPALPQMQEELRRITHAAMDRGLWRGNQDDLENEPNEYFAAIYDNYLDLWTVPPTVYEGRPIPEGRNPAGTSHFGGYGAAGRERMRGSDPEGLAILQEFFPPFLTYTPEMPADFEGTFSMQHDASLRYTTKSQHLKNARLTGSNNAGLTGNGWDNQLNGNDGDNTLRGNAGDDVLDGGRGRDTAVYEGNADEYDVVHDGASIRVIDHHVDRDGSDLLLGIERIAFADEASSLQDLAIAALLPKRVDVFGIPVHATAAAGDDKVLHAAAVLAQYLDNDEDGRPDDESLVGALLEHDGRIFMAVDRSELDAIFEQLEAAWPGTLDKTAWHLNQDEITGPNWIWQNLQAEETQLNNGDGGRFDGALEEILHMITHVGLANAYPEAFAEAPGSRLADAMDMARGGQFLGVPDRYPGNAAYSYYDETCVYQCQATEYIYWSMTSLLGGQEFEGRPEDIGQEWRLNTAERLRSGNAEMHALLTDAAFRLPTRLPDGNYSGRPLAIKSSAPTTGRAVYADLLALFEEFRAFLNAERSGGVPDLSAAAMAGQYGELKRYQRRLAAIDPGDWPIPQQVDYQLVRAEMNGLEFRHRVLVPWSLDPGFYNDALPRTRLRGDGPLSSERREALQDRLQSVGGILQQARVNLDDLSAVAGDLGTLAVLSLGDSRAGYESLRAPLAEHHPELIADLDAALTAIDAYIGWIEANKHRMTARAGVGKDNYNWLLKNVYLFPYTWEEVRTIVELEDNRVITYQRLEENRNRDVPAIEPVQSQAEYKASVSGAIDHLMDFLREEEIFTVNDYLTPDEYFGSWHGFDNPWPEKHDYFFNFSHREPLMEETHEMVGHHFDGLRSRNDDRLIRGGRRPFKIGTARGEGFAFALEELLMHAGYLDERNPHGREIAYEQSAFRTVRALSDIYMHSGDWTLADAMEFCVANAPHGELLDGSHHLWFELDTTLRGVGHHMLMVVGKVQFMKLFRDRANQLGDEFKLGAFLDGVLDTGSIPWSLIRWEMTGLDDEIRRLTSP